MSAAPIPPAPPVPSVRVMLGDVITAVCAHYCVRRGDLLSARRTGDLIPARFACFYLAARMLRAGLPAIGAVMNRDPTTVHHGRRKIAERVASDPEFAQEIAGLELGVLCVARTRHAGLFHVANIDARAVARRIVNGGERAAGMASIDEIMELAEALARREDEHEHQDEEEPEHV